MERQQAKTIDERFDEVTQAFLDQRDCIIFVHDKLNTRLDATDRRLDTIDGRLDKMDGRLDKMDGRLDQMDGQFAKMGGRLGRIELILSEVLNEVKALASR